MILMKQMRRALLSLISMAILFTTRVAVAEDGSLRTHRMFSSNMVIQRDKPIMVWGWASPGAKVTVRFGDAQAQAEAAGDKGRWQATLPARPAEAVGRDLVITSGKESLTLTNVVVGDVWVMNGQSNMAIALSHIYEADIEAATANLPLLREVKIDPAEWETLRDDIPADKVKGWNVATPQTARDFSAIGYVFGSRLQQALQIPIGIIDNARGGASIESLVPRQMFKKDPLAARYLESVEKRQAEFDSNDVFTKMVAKWEKDVAAQRAKGVAEAKLPAKPTKQDIRSWNVPGRSPSDAAACYNGMFGAFKGLNIKGVVFHQGFNNAMANARPKRYRVLMRLMIQGWREDFNDPNLPVGVIEFCAGGDSQTRDNFETQDTDAAPFIREAQRLGVADVNSPANTTFIPGYDQQIPGLHPVKKQQHGIRAARWALSKVYGMQIDWDTAALVSSNRQGDEMVLKFDKPVQPDDRSAIPEGFSIAGADGKFYMAHAAFEMKAGAKKPDLNVIHVWSPLVKEPVAVRYAWARSPAGNLKINGKPWLPLTSFRTDQIEWPESDDPTVELASRGKSAEIKKEAAARMELRKTEEAKQALTVLKRLETLGKPQEAKN
jgi:sialate O-acetylesterase